MSKCGSGKSSKGGTGKSRSGGGSEQVLRTKNLSTNSDCLLQLYACAKLYAMTMAVTVTYSQWTGAFHAFPHHPSWFCTQHSARLD